MACVFHKRNGDTEPYSATFGRVGLDIGVTGAGRMAWNVLTSTKGPAPRALAGTYLGATGEASFGLGGGANVLVGGSKRTITLQPLSLDVQTGAEYRIRRREADVDVAFARGTWTARAGFACANCLCRTWRKG